MSAEASHPLEVESHTVLSYHVGVRTLGATTWILCKNGKRSHESSHFSGFVNKS